MDPRIGSIATIFVDGVSPLRDSVGIVPSKEAAECFPVLFTGFDLASLKVESAFIHLDLTWVAGTHVNIRTSIEDSRVPVRIASPVDVRERLPFIISVRA